MVLSVKLAAVSVYGIGLTAIVLVAAPALAQQALPGPAQPGQLQERFRPGPAAPPSGAAPSTPVPVEPAPPGAEATRFRLSEIRLTGVTVYSEEALRPLYADLLGTEVSLAQMIDVANRLTARYRQDGYILSQIIVPEQQIENGIVSLVAVEGFVDKVTITGEVKGPKRLVEEF